MVVFPNCKINLGLNILRKRKDCYHDLETVFYPIPLTDALEIIRDTELGILPNDLRLTTSGLPIDGNQDNNLCVKAYHLLKKDFPALPAIQMHLHKVIPMGAGLGGGSADGAFALKLLNNQFHLGLSAEQLIAYSLQLGSDCPFFILNKPCFATGRGEVMDVIDLDLSAYQFLIVNPQIHIGTGWAFSHITPAIPKRCVKEIIQQPIHTWTDALINDFEAPAIAQYPEIGEIKATLYQQGAIYSSMTGSGSTVFGIFEKGQTTELFFPKHYFVYRG
ncbi:4-(cytidine 5'-diphospho)-2-C-methyl-D-erythritol kinase [Parasediminibacterium sp. JCM 36343]|uniref:4-(cytidine 5'-diphospho)-2-C-methyl-D-erythritol kinase n=1 Tax=Parasediminibacterium sp. JCM 36343 TaxID=3374279 RepID=UPI00397B1F50